MSMTTEIPRDEWQRFFDDFSNLHVGWLVNLEVLDNETGSGLEACAMPLDGVMADRRSGDDTVTILLGDSPERHMAKSIEHATHVRLQQSDDGVDKTLQVESDESTALMHFYGQIPEMADELEESTVEPQLLESQFSVRPAV